MSLSRAFAKGRGRIWCRAGVTAATTGRHVSSLLIALAVMVMLPAVFRWPVVGIFLWFWIGFMNPHRIVWGPFTDIPFAAIVAAVTLVAWAIRGDFRHPPAKILLVLVLAIAFWITLSTQFAVVPESARLKWIETEKILLLTVVAMFLLHSRERLHAVIWVVVLSFGFYGIKGGVFTILSGGAHHVWGPPGSFIADNNALALALIMTLPLIRYLHLQTESRWIRLALLGVMALFVFSVIGSQSRGGLLGLACMGLFLILKSRHRFGLGLGAAALVAIAVAFVPQSYVDRMRTIETYEEDASALSRLTAWKFSWGLALDRPLTGGGFAVYEDLGLFESYVGVSDIRRYGHNAHSIYFEVLGQHGFVGLGLYLALLAAIWRAFSRAIKLSDKRPDLQWARDFAAMQQVSLVGFTSAGAFQNLAFFDLYFLEVTLAAVLLPLVMRAAHDVNPLADTAPAAPSSRPVFRY